MPSDYLRIVIPGEARAWSARIVTGHKRDGGVFATLANSKPAVQYTNLVKDAMWRAAHEAGWPPADGPVELQITSYRQPPKSRPKRRALTPRESYPCSVPDCTNLQKLVEDAGKKILWVDDSRVVDVRTRKFYCEPGEPDRLEIEVRLVSVGPPDIPASVRDRWARADRMREEEWRQEQAREAAAAEANVPLPLEVQ